MFALFCVIKLNLYFSIPKYIIFKEYNVNNVGTHVFSLNENSLGNTSFLHSIE